MVCRKIRISVSVCQPAHPGKTQIRAFEAAVNANAYQRFPKKVLLALADRMVTAIINQKYFDGQLVMDNRLQLLQIHLNAAFSRE